MGQPITVTVRPGNDPAVRILDTNRSLTSMATERYDSVEAARERGNRPPDVLARRLLEAGASHVTIYSNVVTVRASDWASLEPTAVHLVEHLMEYYGEEAGWSFAARGLEDPGPAEPSGLTVKKSASGQATITQG